MIKIKKIKILHVTRATYGGVLEYLKLFFCNLDKNKYEVELVCPSDGPIKKEIELLGVKVHAIDMKKDVSLHDFKYYKELKKYIKDTKPDIVHIHSSKAGVIGRLAAYRNKVPCVYNAHGWAFSMNINKSKKKIYAIVEKMCARITDQIVNISDFEQNLSLKYNIAPRNKMRVIYNGIDIDKYSKNFDTKIMKEQLNINQNAFILGMVARITEQKSPKTFVEIAEKLLNDVENCFFIIVGDGELRNEIEVLIKEKGLDNKFLITGWTNEVPKYINLFDIAVLTSKWEGFGLVLAEYMASGKPIVASNVGGIPNVIEDEVNGLLVPSDDIYGFIKNILKVKNNEVLRRKLVYNGLKCVKKNFNIENTVKLHEKIYLEILK